MPQVDLVPQHGCSSREGDGGAAVVCASPAGFKAMSHGLESGPGGLATSPRDVQTVDVGNNGHGCERGISAARRGVMLMSLTSPLSSDLAPDEPEEEGSDHLKSSAADFDSVGSSRPSSGGPVGTLQTNGCITENTVAKDFARARERAKELDLMTHSPAAPKRRLSDLAPLLSPSRHVWDEPNSSVNACWFDDTTSPQATPRNTKHGRASKSEDHLGSGKVDSDSMKSSRSAKAMLSRSMRRTEDTGSDRLPKGSSKSRLSISEMARRSTSLSLSMSASSLRQSLTNRRNAAKRRGFNFTPAAVREPTITMSPFGNKWQVDAFTLFHNAIRMEMKDMYSLLKSLARVLACMQAEHIRSFYTWFLTFRELVSRTFEFQHRAIIPKASAFLPLQNGLDEETILEAHRSILLYMDRIERLQDDFLLRNNENAFVSLVLVVDDFSKSLLHLFEFMERDLPSLLHLVGRESSMATETRQFLKKSSKASLLLPLLVRPMKPKVSAEWLSDNLVGQWRLGWQLWTSSMEKNHFRIVKKFLSEVPDIELSLPQ